MTDASGGGDREPGQRPARGNELLADLIQIANPLEGPAVSTEELTVALGGLTTQGSGLELHTEGDEGASGGVHHLVNTEWAPDMQKLGSSQARKIIEGQSPRLNEVISHVFGNENEGLTDIPVEHLQHIIGLDILLKMAAGYPAVVVKPDKTWLDVGLLARPEPTVNNTGLQYYSGEKGTPSAVFLPIQGTVTIDIKTGREIIGRKIIGMSTKKMPG